mmetsp:Transcript_53026/g.103740  ORF Transcript_53026/g.103740 Transcript_53026/m.103740 type:complete len:286 (-) Transcript_53026:183-1040(-)
MIEVEILLNLGLFPAVCGLVDRELHKSTAVRHHLAHQAGIFSGDVLVIERHQIGESQNLLVPLAPLCHLPPSHVCNHVVDYLKAYGGEGIGFDRGEGGTEPRSKNSVVGLSLHEFLHGVSVSFDPTLHDNALLVLKLAGLKRDLGTSLHRLCEGLARVRHGERDVLDTVPVFGHVGPNVAGCVEGRSEDNSDVALLHHVARCALVSCFKPRIGDRLESHHCLIPVSALLRIAAVDFDVVNSVQGHVIVLCCEQLWWKLGRTGAASVKAGLDDRLCPTRERGSKTR